MSEKVIDFQQVSVVYPNGKRALRNISLSIVAGECLALVGESGCGKSTLARVALGILPPITKVSGSIKIGEVEVIGATKENLRKLRGLTVGFVSQNPFSACNPLTSVGDFVRESWRAHSRFPLKNAIENSLENLGITDVNERIKQLPHEWSGGMLQRAGIAAASAHCPRLIIADEPTSSLDTEANRTVLESFRKTDSAILLISHDLRLVEKYADRIAVMQGGEIVEINEVKKIFRNPKHQFTKELLSLSICDRNDELPVSVARETVLEARNLGHSYGENEILAGISFQIKAGEIIGICGASGCGKSTLLRLLATIETPKSGEVFLGGELAANDTTKKLFSKNTRNGYVIPIFQDAFSSLDRRWSVWRIVTEPLTAERLINRVSAKKRREIARQKLAEVGLPDVNLDAKPPELSIGQCQRIAIARALVAKAKIILADEPTSSLDVLNGELVMRLFAETAKKGTAIIIVSHNRDLLRRYCHRVYSLQNQDLEEFKGN